MSENFNQEEALAVDNDDLCICIVGAGLRSTAGVRQWTIDTCKRQTGEKDGGGNDHLMEAGVLTLARKAQSSKVEYK